MAFTSLAALARKHGIKECTLRARLRAGRSLEKALTEPVGRVSKLLPDGEARTLSQVAGDAGISRSTLVGRLISGHSLATAVTKGRLPRRTGRIPSSENRSLETIEKDPPSSVTFTLAPNRVSDGWTWGAETTREKGVTGRFLSVGCAFKSQAALGRKVGLSRERVRQLLSRGESVESILEGSYKKQHGVTYKIPGHGNLTIREIAELAGLSYAAVYLRVKRGVTGSALLESK